MRKLVSLLLVGTALIVARPALAYVLPADFLARLWADSRRASLRDATLILSMRRGEEEPREGRLYLKRPERMRLVYGDGDGAPVAIVREGLGASGEGSQISANGPSDELLPLLMFPRGKDLDETSARIIEGLVSLGIDANTTAFARHADGIAYIIGAQSWESERPQLWLDKATFTPVRLTWRQNNAPTGTLKQLRLLGWSGGWPRALEWYQNGELRGRAEVQSVAINQQLPETLFDVVGPASRRD